MERLTIPDVRVDEHTTRRAFIDTGAVREHAMEFYCRLKAYEDTGCEPDEVLPKGKADEIMLKLMRLADLESLCNYTRLRELAEADKDGRVGVLPCKIGDTVWLTRGFYTAYQEPVAVTVTAIRFSGDTCTIITDQRRFAAQAIGKTVFLSLAEAEKALAEMEGMENGNKTSL